MNKSNYEYQVSVIVPIYNVAEYIPECVDSIIKQTIGFQKNVQVILVNDGSSDDSPAICEKYAKDYPDNIVYVSQENAGVSAARNKGLTFAKGKYINFIDSDDIITNDMYAKCVNMLEDHDEIDAVCVRMKDFGTRSRYHFLDYKFTGDKIIDIFETPENILIHVNSVLIRHSAIGDLRFDTKLKLCEDTKFIYELVLQKCKYGIISSSLYLHRIRSDNTNAVADANRKLHKYFDTIEYAHRYLIELSKQKYGEVIPYVQYFIMYELQWRVKQKIGAILTDEQRIEYQNNIIDLLRTVDDSCIYAQKFLPYNDKLLTTMLKYGDDVYDLLHVENDLLYYDDIELCPFAKFRIRVSICDIEKDSRLHLIGDYNLLGDYKLFYEIDNEYHEIETYERFDNNRNWNVHINRQGFDTYLDLPGSCKICFYVEFKGKRYKLVQNHEKHARLCKLKHSYHYNNGYLIEMSEDKTALICKHKPSIVNRMVHELRLLKTVYKRKKKGALMRLAYFATKPFYRKPVWLFCDREFMAGDNAEALFRYFAGLKDSSIDAYFIVDKSSKDYEIMKKVGKVASYHSFKYNLLFLHASFLISSHADGYVNNAFGKTRLLYNDLYTFKYVYLTHGILLHDSSRWLNRINKDFSLNVVTSPREYDSIINGPYYFLESQLIKTGMPRYDNYWNSDVEVENKILFMPSWRSSLTGRTIPNTQRRGYNPNFKESEYYLFYQRLFNDSKLIDALESKDLFIQFCVHPSFRAQLPDFEELEKDRIKFVIDANSQYETLSSKGLVTDYSSAACDFAYLEKPVVYANFDLDHIYDVHYYNQGYFDYDRDGFGPNCTTYESLLTELLDMINRDFTVEEEYAKRMEDFFYYRDGDNSKRVLEEIRAIAQ